MTTPRTILLIALTLLLSVAVAGVIGAGALGAGEAIAHGNGFGEREPRVHRDDAVGGIDDRVAHELSLDVVRFLELLSDESGKGLNEIVRVTNRGGRRRRPNNRRGLP